MLLKTGLQSSNFSFEKVSVTQEKPKESLVAKLSIPNFEENKQKNFVIGESHHLYSRSPLQKTNPYETKVTLDRIPIIFDKSQGAIHE